MAELTRQRYLVESEIKEARERLTGLVYSASVRMKLGQAVKRARELQKEREAGREKETAAGGGPPKEPDWFGLLASLPPGDAGHAGVLRDYVWSLQDQLAQLKEQIEIAKAQEEQANAIQPKSPTGSKSSASPKLKPSSLRDKQGGALTSGSSGRPSRSSGPGQSASVSSAPNSARAAPKRSMSSSRPPALKQPHSPSDSTQAKGQASSSAAGVKQEREREKPSSVTLAVDTPPEKEREKPPNPKEDKEAALLKFTQSESVIAGDLETEGDREEQSARIEIDDRGIQTSIQPTATMSGASVEQSEIFREERDGEAEGEIHREGGSVLIHRGVNESTEGGHPNARLPIHIDSYASSHSSGEVAGSPGSAFPRVYSAHVVEEDTHEKHGPERPSSAPAQPQQPHAGPFEGNLENTAALYLQKSWKAFRSSKSNLRGDGGTPQAGEQRVSSFGLFAQDRGIAASPAHSSRSGSPRRTVDPSRLQRAIARTEGDRSGSSIGGGAQSPHGGPTEQYKHISECVDKYLLKKSFADLTWFPPPPQKKCCSRGTQEKKKNGLNAEALLEARRAAAVYWKGGGGLSLVSGESDEKQAEGLQDSDPFGLRALQVLAGKRAVWPAQAEAVNLETASLLGSGVLMASQEDVQRLQDWRERALEAFGGFLSVLVKHNVELVSLLQTLLLNKPVPLDPDDLLRSLDLEIKAGEGGEDPLALRHWVALRTLQEVREALGDLVLLGLGMGGGGESGSLLQGTTEAQQEKVIRTYASVVVLERQMEPQLCILLELLAGLCPLLAPVPEQTGQSGMGDAEREEQRDVLIPLRQPRALEEENLIIPNSNQGVGGWSESDVLDVWPPGFASSQLSVGSAGPAMTRPQVPPPSSMPPHRESLRDRERDSRDGSEPFYKLRAPVRPRVPRVTVSASARALKVVRPPSGAQTARVHGGCHGGDMEGGSSQSHNSSRPTCSSRFACPFCKNRGPREFMSLEEKTQSLEERERAATAALTPNIQAPEFWPIHNFVFPSKASPPPGNPNTRKPQSTAAVEPSAGAEIRGIKGHEHPAVVARSAGGAHPQGQGARLKLCRGLASRRPQHSPGRPRPDGPHRSGTPDSLAGDDGATAQSEVVRLLDCLYTPETLQANFVGVAEGMRAALENASRATQECAAARRALSAKSERMRQQLRTLGIPCIEGALVHPGPPPLGPPHRYIAVFFP
uniref:Uncharacterized protein n=1 Tax=Chromera velia CCMP2878 TaxID=1169474 RepID=A0A0G4HLX7_9ALVE|eukprot:Cvel_29074.t1-p1 / transcript=Cvel_29074.t1 / gene=Cvel_29074 / organism=Chromera_velia_CCMP2878 / gene_product=hypothetical protein / transcript_product=hypothetical protein / location=Cvel_scaffold3923:918-6341(-) / protein_length=1200 / sequence_SO=supercontig / SO=protein_coding / is_pseudo=false